MHSTVSSVGDLICPLVHLSIIYPFLPFHQLKTFETKEVNIIKSEYAYSDVQNRVVVN